MLTGNSEFVEATQPSSQAGMVKALEVLTTHKEAWARMEIPERIALLDQLKADLPGIENRWVAAGLAARGAKTESLTDGVEWTNFSLVYKQIRALRQSLQDISRFGKPRLPGKVYTRYSGQVVVQVHPVGWMEQVALAGMRAEVWMDPSVSLKNGDIPQASFYKQKEKKGQVCVILGAGNVGAMVLADVMNKLFVEGQVVALKMNPVNAYLGLLIQEGFRALIQAGYLQVLYGGAQEGGFLTNHSQADTVHMTGSIRTFEAIVFGPGAEGQERKQAREPRFTKNFTAELGNISPVIIVPGPWTEQDIQKQAARIGSWLTINAGCNCASPRMLIQMKTWDHRQKLQQAIAQFLAGIETQKAFYPGSSQLYQDFTQAHPQALKLGNAPEGHLPWTFIQDVDSTNVDEICFRREPFMSLFSETALEAGSVVEFIHDAVRFANERLWGTLCASIVVHPASMKDPTVAAAVDEAVANLRYGSVAVNFWGSLGFYFPLTPWGGYPGSDIYDIQSGTGVVNNPLMFDRSQKSVCYAEFNPVADPQLANLSKGYLFGREEVRYQANPTISGMFKVLWTAITAK